MKLWIKIIAGAIPGAAAFLLLLSILLRRRKKEQKHQQLMSTQTSGPFSEEAVKFEFGNHSPSLNKLHLPFKSSGAIKNSLRFHHLQHHHQHAPPPPQPPTVNFKALPSPPPFRWEEHPLLITEAAENGWPRFGFSASVSRSSLSPLRPLYRDAHESSWEILPGSTELMQTVRLNPELNRTAGDPPLSCLRASLPLPGPALGGACFPQESYFEITILNLHPNPTSLPEQNLAAVALGLTSSVSLPSHSMPGTYLESIGFRSDGSLYLDGRKLAVESEKEWGVVNRVIGCGFEPRKKKVIFTVDSRMVHAISCSSEGYSGPMYPILAASDAETVLLVNLGQAPFRFSPANAMRTANPCFLRLRDSVVRRTGSLERMEREEWAEHSKRSKVQNNSSSKKSNGASEDVFDDDSELFEIVLLG